MPQRANGTRAALRDQARTRNTPTVHAVGVSERCDGSIVPARPAHSGSRRTEQVGLDPTSLGFRLTPAWFRPNAGRLTSKPKSGRNLPDLGRHHPQCARSNPTFGRKHQQDGRHRPEFARSNPIVGGTRAKLDRSQAQCADVGLFCQTQLALVDLAVKIAGQHQIWRYLRVVSLLVLHDVVPFCKVRARPIFSIAEFASCVSTPRMAVERCHHTLGGSSTGTPQTRRAGGAPWSPRRRGMLWPAPAGGGHGMLWRHAPATRCSFPQLDRCSHMCETQHVSRDPHHEVVRTPRKGGRLRTRSCAPEQC